MRVLSMLAALVCALLLTLPVSAATAELSGGLDPEQGLSGEVLEQITEADMS